MGRDTRRMLLALSLVALAALVAGPALTDEPKPPAPGKPAGTGTTAEPGDLPKSAEPPLPNKPGTPTGDPNALPGEPGGENPLTLTVGPGSRALDPIAVPPALCNGGGKACATVTQVIARDLMLSGYFNVLDPASYIADQSTESLTATKWEDWFNIGAKYLVKVRVQALDGGKVELSFRLYDVNQHKVIDVKFQEATVAEGRTRGAAHEFVNEVIRAITGSPGFFGGTILYAAKTGKTTRGIFAIGTDGVGKRTLAAGDTVNMLPSMAGGKLLYTSFREGKPDIYLGDTRITKDDRQYRGARLSPDGKVFAVSADNDGQSDIFLMSPDGELLQNLTNSWADEVSPVWTPSGGSIIFVSNRTGGPQLYIMSREGGEARRLSWAGNYNSTPDYCGGMIVFAGMDGSQSDIFLVDTDGNMNRVTQDQGSNKDPTFSPDCRHLAFVSDRDGKTRIFVSTVDGRYQYPITDKSSSYSELYWVK